MCRLMERLGVHGRSVQTLPMPMAALSTAFPTPCWNHVGLSLARLQPFRVILFVVTSQ